MKIFLVSLLLHLSICELKSEDYYLKKYQEFNLSHGKLYSNQKDSDFRYNVFKKNVITIDNHNSNKDRTFTLGINKFSDLTFEEFKNQYLMKDTFKDKNTKKTEKSEKDLEKLKVNNENKDTYFNWKDEGKLSDVKDQGQCGSCYSFAVTGLLEAHYRINNLDNNVLFSEQEIVDCWCNGCSGGNAYRVLNYIRIFGLNRSSDYKPYAALQGECDKFKNDDKKYIKKNQYYYKQAFQNKYDFEEVKEVLKKSPVAVSIEVDKNFKHYHSGIFTPKIDCGDNTNHAVLLVGYGTKNSKNYTIIKNSWGSYINEKNQGWGEDGYMRIYFDKSSNSCGVTNQNSVIIKELWK